MNKTFKLSTLNLFASMFCFLAHSYSIKNANTLIVCVALSIISYVCLTVSIVFNGTQSNTESNE